MVEDDEPTHIAESSTSVLMVNSDDSSNAYALDSSQFLLNNGTPGEKSVFSDGIKHLY